MLPRKNTHVASLCFKCFMCFERMLRVFHLDISKVDLGVAHVANGYTRLFQSHVPNVSSVFRRMLQMFHLNVSKVDQVLHMLQ